MSELDHDGLLEALSALGETLRFRGASAELAIIGGSGLLLLGLVRRTTQDVDVVGVLRNGELARAEPLPAAVHAAAIDVAAALDLPTEWLNPGPTDLLRFGLPAGFLERAHARRFGSLVVHVASRVDQIHFKLFAAVDQGVRSKHMADLRTLAPQRGELLAAARWCRVKDPSVGFLAALQSLLTHLDAEVSDGEL